MERKKKERKKEEGEVQKIKIRRKREANRIYVSNFIAPLLWVILGNISQFGNLI